MMNKSRVLPLIALCSVLGCAKTSGDLSSIAKGPIGGKFLVEIQNHHEAGDRALYILSDSVKKNFIPDFTRGEWAESGNVFAASSADKDQISTFDANGNFVARFDMPFWPSGQVWIHEDTKLIAIGTDRKPFGDQTKKGDFVSNLMRADLKTSEIKIIHTYEKNYYVSRIAVSPNGRYVAAAPSPRYKNGPGYIEILDLETLRVQKYPFGCILLGWYADNNSLAAYANYYAEGKHINDGPGALVKYDLNSQSFKVVYEPQIALKMKKIYGNGRYLGYTAPSDQGGLVCYIHDLKTGETHQITQATKNPKTGEMSQDWDFDWYPPADLPT